MFILTNEPVQWLTPGTNVTVQNSRCTLNGLGSSVNTNTRGELSVTLSLTFKNTISQGSKSYWAAAIDADQNSGWVQLSGRPYCVRACSVTATPNEIPASEPPSPAVRTGAYEVFSFKFSDNDGAGDIAAMQVLMNNVLDATGACYFNFDAQAAGGRGVLYLVDIPGNGSPVI